MLTANPEGKASVNSQPNINSDNPTKIEGLAVTLNEPGDKVSFTVDLVNESDINAITRLFQLVNKKSIIFLNVYKGL